MIDLLIGEEGLLVRERLEKLLSERLPPQNRDFNLDLFEGEKAQAREIIERCQTFPMLALRRIVLIRNAQGLKKGEMESLETFLPSLPETTDLILVTAKIDGRLSFWKLVQKMGRVTEFKSLNRRDASQWLSQEASDNGYRLQADAAGWIIAALGTDLATLSSTLQKLFLLKGEKKEIILADVESCITAISWKNIFELTEAVGEKDLRRTLTLFQKMSSSGESPVGMLALLARHFRILTRVREGDSAGIPPFFVEDYRRQATRFSPSELDEKREKIFYADWSLKSSPIDSTLLFERLLIDLCR